MKSFAFVISSLLLCSLWSLPARAEEEAFSKAHGDFFRLMFAEREDLKASYTLQRDVKEKDGPGKYDLDRFLFQGEVALPFQRDTYARIGGAYGARLYDFSFDKQAGSEKKTLHRAEVSGGMGTFLTDDFLLTGDLSLGAYSDFESSLETDDFKVFGGGLGAFRVNPGAQLLFGVRVSKDFDDTSIFPLVGFRMMSESGKFHVSLTLPLELRLSYNFDPSLQLYGLASLAGEEYRVDSADSKDRFNLFVQDRHLGLGIGWWVLESLKLGLEAGVSIQSQLEFKSEHENAFDGDLDPSGYFIANFGVAL